MMKDFSANSSFGHSNLIARILPLCLGAACLAGPVAGDTPKNAWPPLLTNHGQPLQVAGSIHEAVQGPIDFLITGIPMGDDELRQAYKAQGVNLVHIATTVTSAVTCYNLNGVDVPLNFSGETLARIFLGRIRKWNDPALAALNPTIKLPASDIVLIGHAGEDGSTYAWTDFLSKSSREWRNAIGNVRELLKPVPLARGQTEDEVAALVEQTPNSIGYVELWSAKSHKVEIGRVQNRSGHYVDPSTNSMSAAALSSTAEIMGDIRASISDAGGPDAYPISVLAWVVVPDRTQDPEKRSLVLSFLKWILTEGQAAPETTYHGHLPPAVISHELRLIDSLH